MIVRNLKMLVSVISVMGCSMVQAGYKKNNNINCTSILVYVEKYSKKICFTKEDQVLIYPCNGVFFD